MNGNQLFGPHKDIKTNVCVCLARGETESVCAPACVCVRMSVYVHEHVYVDTVQVHRKRLHRLHPETTVASWSAPCISDE